MGMQHILYVHTRILLSAESFLTFMITVVLLLLLYIITVHRRRECVGIWFWVTSDLHALMSVVEIRDSLSLATQLTNAGEIN